MKKIKPLSLINTIDGNLKTMRILVALLLFTNILTVVFFVSHTPDPMLYVAKMYEDKSVSTTKDVGVVHLKNTDVIAYIKVFLKTFDVHSKGTSKQVFNRFSAANSMSLSGAKERIKTYANTAAINKVVNSEYVAVSYDFKNFDFLDYNEKKGTFSVLVSYDLRLVKSNYSLDIVSKRTRITLKQVNRKDYFKKIKRNKYAEAFLYGLMVEEFYDAK
jgi:hypothetical protein